MNYSKKLSLATGVLTKLIHSPRSHSLMVWSRSLTIVEKLVGLRFKVYNGKEFILIQIKIDMVGHKLGEFVSTRARYEFKKKKKK